MTFEEALTYELNVLPYFNGNISPLHMNEAENTPYMTYYKRSLSFEMDLSGTMNKVDGIYAIDIIHTKYGPLQKMFRDIKTICASFLNRKIGVNGPQIEYVAIENLNDDFYEKLGFYQLNFELKVKYKEVE